MREIDLRHTYSAAGKEALRARQVRHLEARLRDFGPDGPEVLEADQASGTAPRKAWLRGWSGTTAFWWTWRGIGRSFTSLPR